MYMYMYILTSARTSSLSLLRDVLNYFTDDVVSMDIDEEESNSNPWRNGKGSTDFVLEDLPGTIT